MACKTGLIISSLKMKVKIELKDFLLLERTKMKARIVHIIPVLLLMNVYPVIFLELIP